MTEKSKALISESGVEPIEWETATVPVMSLIPLERNPRKITKDAVKLMAAVIEAVGFHTPIITTHDGKILGGHVRIAALKSLGKKHVLISRPSRELTEAEFKKVLITSNTHYGEWDVGILHADFELGDFEGLGMPDSIMGELEPIESKPKKEITDAEGYCCLIEFTTEAEQAAFFTEMEGRGLTVKLMS